MEKRNVKSGRTILERLEYYSMPEPNTGCQLWIGATNPHGYGALGVGKSGKIGRAHRISFEAHKGEIPKGMFVCHKCDTPACINPDHLFLGTCADNTNDMIKKGRANWGYQSKLTDQQVRAIRDWNGELTILARKFNVSLSLVSRIKSGERRQRVA